MINTVRHSTAQMLVLACSLAGCATTVEELDEQGPILEVDGPPEGAIAVGELSEEELLAQLATDELTEVPLDPAGFSVHSCAVGAYAPFGHAGNLHGKGYLSCAESLGLTYEVRANLQIWYGGRVYDHAPGFYAVCVTSGLGCTADYYTSNWGPHYYRTRIQIVFQGGGVVRTAYTGFVWRQP